MKNDDTDYLGFGLGLREVHGDYILKHLPPVDWFEVLSEDFLVPGGNPLFLLDSIRKHYPIVMHGVSLSIGGTDPLNQDYLKRLKALAERAEPRWISDHLCWTGFGGVNTHDLLPLPYTEEAVHHVVSRVKQVQDYLGRQILLENVSSYITYQQSELTEYDFLAEVAERADCFILLDVNNIYVSGFNHNFDPIDYLDAMPVNRIKQFHMAGHSHEGTHILDTHGAPIIDVVYKLYRESLKRFGKVSTIIERDDNIPEFPVLLSELEDLKAVAASVLGDTEQ